MRSPCCLLGKEILDFATPQQEPPLKLQPLLSVFAALAALSSGLAHASDAWPTKPVRIIVGYPSGTSPDTVARLIQPGLSKALGQPVVIENKPGAGGNIGVDLVVKSQDGHTIGFTTNGPLTSSKPLYAKLPFDPAKDVRPLSLAAVSPLVLAIDNNVPATHLKEFMTWAKTQEQGVTYGSIGNGSGSHLTMELFAHRSSLRMVHVPYQGFPQVTSAIIAHDVQSGFMAPSGALTQSKAGKMRILGISSSRKSELLPEVPTIADAAGLPDFNAELWIAAFAPASMPEAVAQRVAAEINAVLRQPEARAKLAEQGWEARGESPQVLLKRIADDTRLWERVIQQSNIRAE